VLIDVVQDYYPDDIAVCYGCGRNNPEGMHIRTRWDGKEGVFRFTPAPYHTAFPGAVYGGLIACLMDCHSIGTCVAAAYEAEGRAPGTEPEIIFVTGSLNVTYLAPTPIDAELTFRTTVKEQNARKIIVVSRLYAREKETARGEVTGIRVPSIKSVLSPT